MLPSKIRESPKIKSLYEQREFICKECPDNGDTVFDELERLLLKRNYLFLKMSIEL